MCEDARVGAIDIDRLGGYAREHAPAIRKTKSSTCGDDFVDVPVADVADVEFAAGVFA